MHTLAAWLVGIPRWVAPLVVVILVGAATRIDLSPQVSAGFFFASDDPAIASSRVIEKMFPSREQLLISATGNLYSSNYLDRIETLSEQLLAVPGVSGLRSLSHGPDDLEEALESPLWSSLLIGPDKLDSLIIVFAVQDARDDLVADVMAVADAADSEAFRVRVSGVPHVMAAMKRALTRDLRTINLAALGVMAIIMLVAFRSLMLLAAALLAGVGAVMLTLLIQAALGIPVGALTANLAAIVIVIALSHVVYLTHNWRRHQAGGPSHALAAIKQTLPASSWSMLTTLLSFGSLMLVDAEPLQQLGATGAVGTLCAWLAVYTLYSPFLATASSTLPPSPKSRLKRFPGATLLAIVVVLLAAYLTVGVGQLRTDPTLLDYFEPGSEIRSGLEHFDERGGAGILKMVVGNTARGGLDTTDSYERLWALHQALSKHPAVGVPISLPLLMAEGDRHPLSFLVTWARLLKIMGSQEMDGPARSFITADHRHALFVVRMRENYAGSPRKETIRELTAMPARFGLRAELAGGTYWLQAKLAEQVSRSLLEGTVLVVLTFVVVAWFVTRSAMAALAMAAGLGLTAGAVIGLFGWLGLPLGIIAAPGLSIGLGVAVDGMIHVARARQVLGTWSQSLHQQRASLLTSAILVSAGFAVLLLSEFPPNQKLAVGVIAATVLVTGLLLLVLPPIARRLEPPEFAPEK